MKQEHGSELRPMVRGRRDSKHNTSSTLPFIDLSLTGEGVTSGDLSDPQKLLTELDNIAGMMSSNRMRKDKLRSHGRHAR